MKVGSSAFLYFWLSLIVYLCLTEGRATGFLEKHLGHIEKERIGFEDKGNPIKYKVQIFPTFMTSNSTEIISPAANVTRVDDQNSSKDQTKQPTNQSLSNESPANVLNSKTDESQEGGIGWIAITIIVFCFVLLIIIGAVVFYYYSKKKRVNTIKDYAMNQEQSFPKQKFNLNQKLNLNSWNLQAGELTDVFIKSEEGPMGKYFQVKFAQIDGEIRTIKGNKTIDESKENSYFEIEIEDIKNIETDVIIGFSTKEGFNSNLIPGESNGSVGFHSLTGSVTVNFKPNFTHDIIGNFGDTLGVGIRAKDGRIWLSYNGKFLNPPPPSEAIAKSKGNQKDKTADIEEREKKEKEALNSDLKPKVCVFSSKFVFPVISSTGRCTLNVNFGGQPFRFFQKEIAMGLL